MIERLLEKLEGNWGVCKVTVCRPGHDHRCPHGKSESCGVCSENLDSFIAETDENVLRTQGKDTMRYYAAGAEKVVWVRAQREYLKQGVQKALDLLAENAGIIFEGNNALTVMEPDLAVMVHGNPIRYKASARPVLHKIDIQGEASDPILLEQILSRVLQVKNHI